MRQQVMMVLTALVTVAALALATSAAETAPAAAPPAAPAAPATPPAPVTPVEPGPPTAPADVNPQPSPLKAPAPGSQVTDEVIDAAIAKAVAYLWTQQQDDGSWPFREEPDKSGVKHSVTGSRWPPGETCMVMMALEYANLPLDEPRYQKGMKVLQELTLDYTYMRAIRVVTMAHLYQRMPKEKRGSIRQAMKADVDWLCDAERGIGGWRYGGNKTTKGSDDRDISNSQLAILALSEAAKCGVEVPQENMMLAQKRLLEDQQADGGWNYGDPNAVAQRKESYGNMTAAAVASLFLTSEYLYGALGCPCKGDKSTRGQNIAAEAVKRGMLWLNKEFLPDTSPKGYHYFYWLYQAERVGLATGYRYFGTHDWFNEGAACLLTKQVAGSGAFGANVVDTSFAILFLIKGRGTLLYNKLEYEGDWNLHQHDIRNLSEYISNSKEQPIVWQVLQQETPVALWFDAPVLYITGEGTLKLSAELKKKLRLYTDNGGTLLLEASCGNQAAKIAWNKLAQEIWPEWELKKVDAAHQVWTADIEVRGQKPALMHMEDGVRSFIFYAPVDMSCAWHTNGVTKGKPWFDFGLNLAAYASDKGRLRTRLTGSRLVAGQGLEGQTIAAGPKKEIAVARLKHGGDYYVGRNYQGLDTLSDFLRENLSLTLKVKEELDPAAEKLADYDLLWLSGRQTVSLSDSAKAALKDYLKNGGFLVAENVMGDPRFTDSFEALMKELDLQGRPLGAESDIMTGKFEGAAGYNLMSKVKFSRSLAVKRIAKDTAELVGLFRAGKLVGVQSPYDVLYSLKSCPAFGRQGYDANSAMAVATNLVLKASLKPAEQADPATPAPAQ